MANSLHLTSSSAPVAPVDHLPSGERLSPVRTYPGAGGSSANSASPYPQPNTCIGRYTDWRGVTVTSQHPAPAAIPRTPAAGDWATGEESAPPVSFPGHPPAQAAAGAEPVPCHPRAL